MAAARATCRETDGGTRVGNSSAADLRLPRRPAGPGTWEPSTWLTKPLPATEKVSSHVPIIVDGLWSRHSTLVSHSLVHRPEQQQRRSSGAQPGGAARKGVRPTVWWSDGEQRR